MKNIKKVFFILCALGALTGFTRCKVVAIGNNDSGTSLEGAIQITGDPHIGSSLKANILKLAGSGDINYQWYRNDKKIENAVSAEYTVSVDDFKNQLRVQVGRQGSRGMATSPPTRIIGLNHLNEFTTVSVKDHLVSLDDKSPISMEITKAAYGKDPEGNEVWLIIGRKGDSYGLAYSNDCVNWIEVSDRENSLYYIYDLIYADGIWAAVDSKVQGEKKIITSTDGKKWSKAFSATSGFSYLYNIVYGGNLWAAGSASIADAAYRLIISADGKEWQISEDPYDLTRAVYGNGGWLNNKYLIHSPNPRQFPHLTEGRQSYLADVLKYPGTFKALAFGDGIFIIAYKDTEDELVLAYSEDNGQTWNKTTAHPFTESYRLYIVRGDTRWAACDYAGNIAWSEDGRVWTPVENPFEKSKTIFCLAYGNGRWLIGGEDAQIAFADEF